MSAQASLVVYPESIQSSIGLPGSLSSGLLVDTMDFDYGGNMQEWSDEDDYPDIIVISNFKILISVKAVMKSRSSEFGTYASGCTKLGIATLPFNSALWTQGYNTMLNSGAYGILMSPKRTAAKAKPDDFSFDIRMHGFKPATRFPV